MQTLLTLPPELRLKIYGHALSDQPIEIDVNEYWTNNDPKFWEILAEPLARLDPSLASDVHALHWSRVTITFSEKINVTDFTPNKKFIFWLLNFAEPILHGLGKLSFQRHWRHSANIPHPGCVDFAEIDFKTGQVSLGNTNSSEPLCKHGELTHRIMEEAVGNIPRDRGRLQPWPSDLWGLFELWRLTFYKNPGWPRGWESVRSGSAGSFSAQMHLARKE